MMRLASTGSVAAQFVGAGLRRGEIERAGVDRAAADHAADAFALHRAQPLESARFDSPPEAMTGMLSACASLTVASMLMPVSMPSRPMSV